MVVRRGLPNPLSPPAFYGTMGPTMISRRERRSRRLNRRQKQAILADEARSTSTAIHQPERDELHAMEDDANYSNSESSILSPLFSLEEHVAFNVMSFLTPQDIDRLRGSSRHIWRTGRFGEGEIVIACKKILELHRQGQYAPTPRDVAYCCLPQKSLNLVRLRPDLKQAAAALPPGDGDPHHPSRLEIPAIEGPVAFHMQKEAQEQNQQNPSNNLSWTEDKEELRSDWRQHRRSPARNLTGKLLRQRKFKIHEIGEEVYQKKNKPPEWSENDVPLSDLDGAILVGAQRTQLQVGDIVRLLFFTFKDGGNKNSSEDESSDGELEENTLFYALNEDCYSKYVCLRITKVLSRGKGHGRHGRFVGTVLPTLLQPLGLRLVLPGDAVSFNRRHILQVPLAMNPRLKDCWRPTRHEPARHYDRKAVYSPLVGKDRCKPDQCQFWNVAVARVLTCWSGRSLDPAIRSYLGPGDTARCTIESVCSEESFSCYVTILAVDHQDPMFVYGEQTGYYNASMSGEGAVMKIHRSAFSELPINPWWNPPELTSLVVREEGGLAVTGATAVLRDQHMLVEGPADWNFPTD